MKQRMGLSRLLLLLLVLVLLGRSGLLIERGETEKDGDGMWG